mmetsp:Transcript_17366/g.20849  ORF Transcript_17366/g.20849 Transcript_17366/m.20849 type:complete len:230 (-) Transcript_17366:104-793(-)
MYSARFLFIRRITSASLIFLGMVWNWPCELMAPCMIDVLGPAPPTIGPPPGAMTLTPRFPFIGGGGFCGISILPLIIEGLGCFPAGPLAAAPLASTSGGPLSTIVLRRARSSYLLTILFSHFSHCISMRTLREHKAENDFLKYACNFLQETIKFWMVTFTLLALSLSSRNCFKVAAVFRRLDTAVIITCFFTNLWIAKTASIRRFAARSAHCFLKLRWIFRTDHHILWW